MRALLATVLVASVGLGLLDVFFLTLGVACVIAIVLDSYFQSKSDSFERQRKDVESLAEEVKSTIRALESEQGVLKLKVQNLTNPGRKL